MLNVFKRRPKSAVRMEPRLAPASASLSRGRATTKRDRGSVRKRSARWAWLVDAADRAVFSWKVRRKLYKHLAGQVGNGVPVEVALEKHASQLARANRTSSARIVRDASRLMRDGKSLADSLRNWIPADEAGFIAAAELASSKVLPASLKELVETKRRVKRVAVAFRNALVRPAVYTLTMYGVVWAIGKYAVPQMTQALPASRATGAVAGLYAAGDFAMSWLAVLPPVCLLLLGLAIKYAMPRWRGRWRVYAESYFPFNYYRDSHGFLWLSSFVALLKAGKPDVDILQMQITYASPWLKERLAHCRRTMIDGALLPAALAEPAAKKMPAYGFPNPDIVSDIESFSGFPDFPEKIKAVLQEWAEDLEESTLENAALFGFLLEIVMYVVMGFLMYAINELTKQAHF
jgi:type II secretory pathway component PulF